MGFKAVHYSEVQPDTATECGTEGVTIRWLITKDDGAENFAMRYFEMAPGGHSPYHSHMWEHEVFVLEGECLVICGDQKKKVGSGSAVFIPSNVQHNFRNEGKGALKFICLVPHHE